MRGISAIALMLVSFVVPAGPTAAAPPLPSTAVHIAMAAQVAQGAPQALISPSAPPPPRDEIPLPPPNNGPTTIYELGHWSWTGTDWAWVHGQYIIQPTSTARWEPGHWIQQSNGWVWIEGQWR